MNGFRFHGGIGNYYAERRLHQILASLPLPSPPAGAALSKLIITSSLQDIHALDLSFFPFLHMNANLLHGSASCFG